jgi:hypothetical protein
MKFVYIGDEGGKYNLYGYNFPKGEVVDVIGEGLSRKFRNYPDFKEVRHGDKRGNKKLGPEEDQGAGGRADCIVC